jgi:tetratricopeptide (TPR) repeat protein
MSADSPPIAVIRTLSIAAVLSKANREADLLLRRATPAAVGTPGPVVTVERVLREVDTIGPHAVDQLPPPSAGDLAQGESFRPVYLRGLIYLRAGDGWKAAAEFQRILDHRGVAPASPLYPLAYLQQARAYGLSGDQIKARKAYDEFLAVWKDADPDIPILRAARLEYARLIQ